MKKSLLTLLFLALTSCDASVESDTTGRSFQLPPVCGNGCTYTMGWYKNHDQWPISQDTPLCGKTYAEWLDTPPQGDAWVILTHQWITAYLNVLNGAQVDAQVLAALQDGSEYVLACTVSDDDKADATAISEVLDAFNNGELSAPHCDDVEEDGPT